MQDARLTIADLVERTGVNPVTLRSWVRLAIVPRGVGHTKGTRYTEEYVLRIRAVQALRAQGFGLMQVAHRVRLMGPVDLAKYAPQPANAATAGAAMASNPDAASSTSTGATDGAVPYKPNVLEWVQLMPGITLFVDPKAGEMVSRVAREIVARYGLHPDARSPRG